ncbi:MAG: hypothetical protein K2W96_22905, partial [Gemmataceae bacterium]|nr:hypothetical protein [Gemmataceae bacterium]
MSATMQKPAKHEAAIREGLDRARGRVRLLDLVSGVLGLAALVLGFICLMVLLDAALSLSLATRQFALLLFLAGAGFYVWAAVVRPWRREVNPWFAARELEKTVPGSRDRVVAWLDLEGEPMPGVFRAGLGSRAARDIGEADLEVALPSSRTWAVAACAAGTLFLFVLLFILFGPKPFGSLLARALGLPGSIAKRTKVAVVRPGDHVATTGTPVAIVARIEGRIPSADAPDAPALVYRKGEDDPPRRRPLARDEAGEWTAALSAEEIGSGFLYKVAAGDDETEEYTVATRAAPLLSDFLAVYRYRPYVQRGDATRTARRLDDLRGTEVTITARANRAAASARLEVEKGAAVAGSIAGKRLEWKLVLDRPGRYRLAYDTPEGESYSEEWHDLAVQDDGAPAASLTLPGKDIAAPANGTVELEGEASDDIGVAGLALHLAVDGKPLPPRPYMAEALAKAMPRRTAYREALALAPLGLAPGTKLEYWLEARDACDAPKPNMARSRTFSILIEGPKDAAAQKKEEEAARKRKEEHDERQEEKLKADAAAKAAQKEKEDKQAKEDAKEREKDGGAGKGEPSKEDGKDDDTRKQADALKDALQNRDKEGKKDGERGAGKGDKDEKPGEKKDGEKDEKKGEGKGGDGKDAGEKKDEGKEGDKKGEGKGEGKEGMDKPGTPKEGGSGGKGEAKPDGKPDGKKGEAKADGNPSGEGKAPGEAKGEEKPGDAKGEGKPAGDGKAGGGKPSPGKPSDKGEGKPGGPAAGKGKAGEAGKGEGKGSSGSAGKGEPKGGAGDPAKATPEDARRLADQAKRGGAEGEAAKKALEGIRDG